MILVLWLRGTIVNEPTLALLIIRTPDVEKLRRFYELIGIQFQKEQHGGGPVHYFSKLGSTIFEIYPVSPISHEVASNNRLGFAVQNLDETFGIIEQSGIEVVSPAKQTEWGYYAIIKDPDGRKVELSQR